MRGLAASRFPGGRSRVRDGSSQKRNALPGRFSYRRFAGVGPAGRALAVAAVVLYAAALLLPFMHGTIRLLVIPVSRSLTLPGFMRHLAHDQPGPVLWLATLVVFVAPALLLLATLACAWPGMRALPRPVVSGLAYLRWRGWIATALGVTFTLGLRAAASASGGPSLRMLPGAWCFCASLVVAAGALSLLAPRRGAAAADGQELLHPSCRSA